jgi:hypothetical protein
MNPVVIVLAIIVIILIYVLYRYFTKPTALSAKMIRLNVANPPIPGTSIPNPTSTRYSYGVWTYINTWTPNQKMLISRGDGPNAEFSLYLDPSQPILYCVVGGQSSIFVTDNFPIQKWVYIVISVDNQFVDCYLDGKLVKSQKLTTQPSTNSSTLPITFGQGSDIYVSNVTRWTQPMDPTTAWSNYMDGNGGSNNVLSSYNLDLTLLKDNVQKSKYTLF